MSKVLILFKIMVLLMSHQSTAEELFCNPSPCSNHSDHVKFLEENAYYIAKGIFSFDHEVPDSHGRMGLRFSVIDTIKADNINKHETITLSFQVKDYIAKSEIDDGEFRDFYKTWRNWISENKNELALERYDNWEKASLDMVIRDSIPVSKNMVSIEVRSGGLDFISRESSALIFEGEEYVLALMREIPIDNQAVLFPWDIDILPVKVFDDNDLDR